MAGFAGRGAVTHVHDDLEATALVFANDVSALAAGGRDLISRSP